jgi:PilZ domain
MIVPKVRCTNLWGIASTRIDAILFKIIFKGCRQHERAELRLSGRYSLGNGKEYSCRTIDVAAGGLAVESEEKGQIGDFVAAYVDHLGHIEGEIVRRLESGFALKILMPPARIEKLASQITSLVPGIIGQRDMV